jgi:hypothetical protein
MHFSKWITFKIGVFDVLECWLAMTTSQVKKKYFIFMDESGNNAQDRFFVLGILMVPVEEVGKLFDFLENISAKIKTRSQERMRARTDEDFKNGNVDKVLEQAKSTKSFEMKFSAINKENQDLYIHILHKYFKQINYRFSAIVFDRQNKNFKPDSMSHWDRYLNNVAMLIASNIKNIASGEFTVIADQITQPLDHHPYENYICAKICERLKIKDVSMESLFGAIRIESHSATFLQLVDIFVGAIGHDFIGEDRERKVEFMKILREKLGISGKIQHSFTKNNPNYFSIWKYEKST